MHLSHSMSVATSTKHHPATPLASGHNEASAHHPKLLKDCVSLFMYVNSNGESYMSGSSQGWETKLSEVLEEGHRDGLHIRSEEMRAGTLWTKVTSLCSLFSFSTCSHAPPCSHSQT